VTTTTQDTIFRHLKRAITQSGQRGRPASDQGPYSHRVIHLVPPLFKAIHRLRTKRGLTNRCFYDTVVGAELNGLIKALRRLGFSSRLLNYDKKDKHKITINQATWNLLCNTARGACLSTTQLLLSCVYLYIVRTAKHYP
jgi:hypothetical protein